MNLNNFFSCLIDISMEFPFFFLLCFVCYSAAATGPTYPATQQAGYAVAPTATAPTYNAQRTGYDQAAYQAAAATQGQYASKY